MTALAIDGRAEAPEATLVSVVVPARDEANDIAACIDALGAQDLPLDELEVIVVDGGSADGTAEVARMAAARHAFARFEVVTNPAATTPSNLNVGLDRARGRYLCRVDSRSLIPRHYVRRCRALLDARPEVAVVGGAQVAQAGSGRFGAGIARALNNPWGMGLARYRAGAGSGPCDTVYLGFFRTNELRAAGGWDTGWATNQDFELNRRMGRTGVVWFEDDISVRYVPRPTLRALAQQYHRFGRWKVRYWRRTGDRPRPRQVVLLVGGTLGAITLGGVAALLVRSPRRGLPAAAALATAAVVVESRSTGPEAGPVARAASVVASGAVAGGWLTGVIRELPSRRREDGP